MSERIKPGDNRPLSELLRLASGEWVDHDAAARMLEELKSTYLEQQKAERVQAALENDGINLPDSHAEREVKATRVWEDYIRKMVEARTLANRAKVQVEYIKMLHWERQSAEANARAERRT